jgi:FlaG/FlaF family flagellin (archaellin)
MTLSDLRLDFFRRFGYASSPATEITTRATAYFNEVQQEILSEPGMGALLNGSITFASVASTPQYSIPQGVARVKTIYEATNDRRLEMRSLDWYRSIFPDVAAQTGIPEVFVDLGFLGVAKQPTDASQLLVDSTSASDTNTAYIEGYRTDGYYTSASVTMTGTTAVNLGTTDIVFVTKFYLSAAAVGTVTLHEDASGGTELARIPIGQTFARYRRIALVPTPASAVTYTIDFEWDPQNMSNSNDEPLLPPRFHRLIGIGARLKEYEKKDDARYGETKAEFEAQKRKLKFFVFSQAAAGANLRGHLHRGYSTLGGQFPAGV